MSLKKGHFEGEREYIVKGNHVDRLYFESIGTAEEIFSVLSYQLSVYEHYLKEGIDSAHLCKHDGYLADVFNRLNKNQGYRDALQKYTINVRVTVNDNEQGSPSAISWNTRRTSQLRPSGRRSCF